MTIRRSPALLAIALACACTPSDDPSRFTGGDFGFQTLDVSDGCLDGAMDVLFMPEGTATDFGDPIYLPAVDEMPATYTISLAEPFNDMEVTVTGDETSREVEGAENDGVEFDADTYPGCLVDNAIDVSLVVDSADEVHGTATLHTSSFDEEPCPNVDEDPCDIQLTLQGTRI